MGSYKFFRLISSKVTSRFYGFFLKLLFLKFFFEKLIFPTMSKTAEFGKKKHKEF
jgi:hypothetical protein